METRISARLTPQEGRKFGLTVGTAFLVLGGVVLWRGYATLATVFGVIGGILLLSGLAVPRHLGPVFRGWMAFGLALSKITTPIFMGLVYFGVLGPVGIIRRSLGKNSVRRRLGETYWLDRAGARKSNLQRQF